MDNGQQTHGQPPNRNSRATNLFPPLLNGTGQGGASSIWASNPITDGLSSRENAGVSGAYKSWDTEGAKLTQPTAPGQSLHSAQRPNGIGGSDGSRWTTGLGTWTSPDNMQSRPNPSRSTSPPSAFQSTSNTSPSFNPGRLTNGQSNTFPTSLSTSNNGIISRGSISGGPQPARVNSFQSGFGGFPRTNSGTSAFDESATSRESGLPSSRHSESETPLQFNNDVSGFPQGIASHSRHASRPSLSAASSSYYQQPPSSRSQSLNPHSDEAALEAARAALGRGALASNSPGPRFNTVQASTPAPSQFGRWDFTPTNGTNQIPTYPQESRRESLAMSINQSAMNSPRAFGGGRPADNWPTPVAPVDLDPLARLQRSQSQISRLANQSPYLDPTFSQINQGQIPDLQTQLMQSLYQYQGYAMPGQQYYPPTAPAAYGARPARNQNPYENYKATPQLLEEFKKTSKGANRKWQLRDIFGYVTDFAGDQQGSRFLQEKIPGSNSDDKQRIFDEILVNANQMMTDVFGNYIVQKLFEYGTLVQKKLLAAKMQGNVVDLSMNIYGCRCIQEALNYILVEQQVEIANELEPDIIRLMQGVHSNHVVQKVLTKLPRERIDFVYDAVRGKVYTLSTQQYACRVIQRMIEQGTEADRAFILDEFHQVAHKLVTDDWGNYVVQAVIKQGGDQARSEVIRICIDQFLAFSKQKVASNVMEHCIQFGSEEDRLEIYNLIMTTRTEDGTGLLQAMWKDQFANYVVRVEQETLIRESRPYYLARKKPSRPDEKWAKFETLMSKFRSTASRQGSISSANGDLNGVTASRPSSQSDMNSAMPTPALTTGGNSPRTSSSQATNDGAAEADTTQPLRDLLNKFDEASIRDKVPA
ncbi:hypothetical protein J7T55_015116 [Diaporthe amygdali]|uniref:uncharacterized protein n=1 Tax=Phomopsis amygdali TaxID=1214568 RepID=UPI0022FED0EF|nr:uncharacterized protein J7T55_015116 [Diaporthe amygdali]KAJ0108682.1 hypothetical protein J7T55_015116 [Diaporthe amygdali]